MKYLFNDLRHHVIFQRLILEKDTQGGFKEIWQNQSDLWIQLTPMTQKGNVSVIESRGRRRQALETKSRDYQACARACIPLKIGMRLVRQKSTFVIVEEPYIKGLYQFFTVSTVLANDESKQ